MEVRPKAGSYDYRNKYTAGCTEYFCPAEFDAATTKRIQDAALGAFQAIGGRDYARVDVMVRADGEPVVLEVNTLPGMTETSLLPKAAAAAGLNYAQLCQRMVDLALKRKSARIEATRNPNVNALVAIADRKFVLDFIIIVRNSEIELCGLGANKKTGGCSRGHVLDVKLRSEPGARDAHAAGGDGAGRPVRHGVRPLSALAHGRVGAGQIRL